MGNQISFGDYEFQMKRKKSKKELFLEKMEKVVPFEKWCAIIRPFYYENGNGRQPIELESMLRMYLVSNWFNLSDEGTEELVDDSRSVRSFVGRVAPDATTLCKFRLMLEDNKLSQKIFLEQNKTFTEKGILLREGTIVDATIIECPKSKKNKEKSLPEGSASTNKYGPITGIKAHIGVDKKSGLVHSIAITPANVSDVAMASELLYGQEQEVYGDSGYRGIDKREDVCEKLHDGTGEVILLSHSHKRKPYYVLTTNTVFHIAQMKSKVTDDSLEKTKSRIRSKVEHIFLKLKHLFKYRKTRYRKAHKNEHHLFMLFTLANLCKVA